LPRIRTTVSLIYILAQEVFDVLEVERLCNSVVVGPVRKFFPDFWSLADLEQPAHMGWWDYLIFEPAEEKDR
jgi:hypothetical protein